MGGGSDKADLQKTYLDTFVGELDSVSKMHWRSESELFNNALASRGYVMEPEVVVLWPEEELVDRVIGRGGGIREVPIQELFAGCLRDAVKGVRVYNVGVFFFE